MKRKYDKYAYLNLKQLYNYIFWHKCINCENEMRREYHWKFNYTYYGTRSTMLASEYICLNCGPTKEDALVVAMRKVDLMEYNKIIDSDIKDRLIKKYKKFERPPPPPNPPTLTESYRHLLARENTGPQ